MKHQNLETYVTTAEDSVNMSQDDKTNEDDSKMAVNKVPQDNNVGNTKEEMIVYVWIDKLDDVKLVDETFYAQLQFMLAWPTTDKDNIEKYGSSNWNNKYEDESLKFFKQTLSIVNGVDVNIGFVRQGVMKIGGTDCWGAPLINQNENGNDTHLADLNFVSYIIKGTFKERFELENFPLDVQDLTIHMYAVNHVDNMSISTAFDGNKHCVNFVSSITVDDVDFDEYNLEKFWIHKQTYKGYEIFKFRAKISRKYGVYFWKVAIYMLILAISSICVFCMNDDNNSISDKISLVLTLLLTGVALQFVVGTWLPNTSYLTLLDKYILLAFFIMFIITMLLFMQDIFDINYENDTKNIISILLVVLFILSQIATVFIMYNARNFELSKINISRDGVVVKPNDDETEESMLYAQFDNEEPVE